MPPTEAIAERRPPTEDIDVIAMRLGVAPERLVDIPLPGTATQADWIAAVERKAPLCEWVDGTLIRKAMGAREARLSAILIQFFGKAAERLAELRGVSSVYDILPGDGMVQSGRNGRIPDVSVLCSSDWDDERHRSIAPTPVLAVEVLSPTNTAREMATKRAEYFAAGVRELWILDPELRQAEIWSAVDRITLVREPDGIDASVCFPGLKVPVDFRLTRRLSAEAEPLLAKMTA